MSPTIGLRILRRRLLSQERVGGVTRSAGALVVGLCVGAGVPGADGQTPAYDFGSPDDSEQAVIEFVNRSRATPGAEAQGFKDAADPAKRAPDKLDWNLADAYSSFGVNMAVAVQRISALAAVPPVAPNAKLMTAARQHTQWMFANKVQSHTQPPATSGSDSIVRRITATGYNWAGLGENIYAYGRDLYYAHASFEVDWGGNDYGMQKPAGHRINNHNKDHREIGIGVHYGFSGYGAGDVGPVVGTVDFGSQLNSSAFVTGVAYYDRNGNQRYDAGEGISGLRVDVNGATHHAITAPGGGYVVPVPTTSANRAVVLSGIRASGQGSATITGGNNVKLDFTPAYVAPVIGNPGPVTAGTSMALAFPTTPGATEYEVTAARVVPAAAENADGYSNFSYYITPSRYSLLQASIRIGTTGAAIHLAHPVLEDQWVMLKPTYLPGPNATLNFQSWLRTSSVRQIARVQVSTDDGQSWTDAWTKVGATNGANGWAPVTVPLASYAGRLVRVRFNYTIKGNTWQAGLGVSTGWFIDDITLPGVEQLIDAETTRVSATGATASVTHTPEESGAVVVAARPVISGRPWGYAPTVRVDVAEASPFVQWARAEEARLGLAHGTLSLNGSEPAGRDAVPSLVRYALGVPADASAAARLPRVEPNANGLCVTYFRDASRTDIQVGLQISPDYVNWLEPGDSGAPLVLSDTLVSVDGTVERRCAIIAPTAGRVAARLRVVATE